MTRALRCQNKHALTTHSLGDTPISATAEYVFQTGISPASHETYAVDETLTHCPVSHELLDVQYEWDKLPVPSSLREFEARWSSRREPLDYSGVWRFRELLPFAKPEQIVTIGEVEAKMAVIRTELEREGRAVSLKVIP